MKQRIFIASHLPDEIKKVFIDYQQRKLNNTYFRFVTEESLHLTLVFIGYVISDDLLKINQISQNVASLSSPIEVKLNKITLGPNLRSGSPIWAEGEISKDLNNLHQSLKNKLINEKISLKAEGHLFRPHVTLARLKNEIKLPNLSELEEKINKSFVIDSLSVIESELNNKGPKYTNLNTFLFKD